MPCWRGPGSASTKGKRRFGTRQGFNILGVRCWKGWRGSWANMHTCGEVQNCPHICKASKFWVHRLVTLTTHMDRTARDHQTLLDRIPLLQDVQAAWLLLLHCASARANYLVRVVEPASAREFCDIHDDRMWQCLEAILQTPFADVEEVRSFGSLPMVLGGIGLRSAARTSKPAYWASWGDSVAMIRRRHPTVADQLAHQLEGLPETPFLRAAADTRRELIGVMGFEPPSWQEMSHGARPPHREPEDVEPGTVRRGWQHEACSRVESRHRRDLFSHTPAQVRVEVGLERLNDAASSFIPGDSPQTPPPGTPSVAVYSILTAIIAPRVHMPVCSVGGGIL